MTRIQEALLAEARRRYPVGTGFFSAAYHIESFVVEENFQIHNDEDVVVKADRPSDGATGSNTFCRYKGKWSDVFKPVVTGFYSIY